MTEIESVKKLIEQHELTKLKLKQLIPTDSVGIAQQDDAIKKLNQVLANLNTPKALDD